MKLTMEFDLPDDEDLFEQAKMGPILWEVICKQRKLLHDYEQLPKAKEESLNILRGLFAKTDEWLAEYGIQTEFCFDEEDDGENSEILMP